MKNQAVFWTVFGVIIIGLLLLLLSGIPEQPQPFAKESGCPLGSELSTKTDYGTTRAGGSEAWKEWCRKYGKDTLAYGDLCKESPTGWVPNTGVEVVCPVDTKIRTALAAAGHTGCDGDPKEVTTCVPVLGISVKPQLPFGQDIPCNQFADEVSCGNIFGCKWEETGGACEGSNKCEGLATKKDCTSTFLTRDCSWVPEGSCVNDQGPTKPESDDQGEGGGDQDDSGGTCGGKYKICEGLKSEERCKAASSRSCKWTPKKGDQDAQQGGPSGSTPTKPGSTGFGDGGGSGPTF